MLITGTEGQLIEFKTTNYQFPKDKGYDGNWLRISVRIETRDYSSRIIDPALTTCEMNELIMWLNNLSRDYVYLHKHLTFIEPDLSFELLNDVCDPVKHIRIVMKSDCLPKFCPPHAEEYAVEFRADNTELRRMAMQLKENNRRYPARE